MNSSASPPLDAFEWLLLSLVAQHDGRWYWYQLDRAIVRRLGALDRPLSASIARLTAAGYLAGRPPADSRPKYLLGPQGHTLLREYGLSPLL
ncbi:hypothetical protein [Hymenobacter edaphi]|nr:hypothetical protein [Hymenobacter edaphi]